MNTIVDTALALGAIAAGVGSVGNARAGTFEDRERDWRNGAIVYQIIIDRFVPSANLDAKRALFPAPKMLKPWSEVPKPGAYLTDQKLAAHELDFWGGDLASATSKLGHVQQLGADVLYLNPIHLAWTNHKYDAFDFQAISPEYGTREDFKRLAADAKRRGLKVVLDGVFNHMGRNAPIFKQALADPKSPYRDWFAIGAQYEGGARVWTGYQNLPELNLENPAVRRHLWLDRDSVVRSYLRDGADGWRLDTAYELGQPFLREMTDAVHKEKPGSLVVGEIVNYPGQWLKSMDAVMNFTLPGAPNLYYGAEVGMTGGADPENCGPMRWDLVRDDNPELAWVRQLIALRKAHRALRVGDFRLVESQRLFAFERHTDRVLESRIVVANPSDTTVRERLLVPNAHLMDDTPMVDVLGVVSPAPAVSFGSGFITIELPPQGVVVLQPQPKALGGYSRYKRVP